MASMAESSGSKSVRGAIQYSKKARPLPKSSFHARSGSSGYSPSVAPGRSASPAVSSPSPRPNPVAEDPSPAETKIVVPDHKAVEAKIVESKVIEAKRKEQTEVAEAGSAIPAALQFQQNSEVKEEGGEATAASLLRLSATPGIDPSTIPPDVVKKVNRRMVRSAAVYVLLPAMICSLLISLHFFSFAVATSIPFCSFLFLSNFLSFL